MDSRSKPAPEESIMAKRNEKIDEAKLAAAKAELDALNVTSASDTSSAAINAAQSNFVGSAEEAFDELEIEGVKDGEGSASLLNAGVVLAKHAKALRGNSDAEFQANCMAARLRYAKGFNSVAAIKNPRALIDLNPDEKSKAYKANKKQANKLGVFIKAGCMFPTPSDAETYIQRTIAAIGATDYGEKRESTFELLARVLRKADATAKDETDETLAEKVKPAEAKEKPAKEEKTETAPVEPTATEWLNDIAARLSIFVAKFNPAAATASKLNAMADECAALAKMMHAADKAEAAAEEKAA
jgi:hypothetical protein